MVQRLAPLIISLAVLVACSGDDDAADVVDATVPADTGTETPIESSAASSTAAAVTETVIQTEPTTPAGDPPDTSTTVIVDVPETGVPGLDSDDQFCAAWSRFGGTWQVLLVGSTFLEDPQLVAGWEVAAAPVVETAFDALMAALPDELAAERSLLEEDYFGVLNRRAEEALASLDAAGSDDAAVAALSRAWIEALATRDPSTPDLEFDVPETLAGLLDKAADDFLTKRVAFHLDPSMVVSVDTPLADAYIETCPDQGTLTGGEIAGDG